MVKIQENKNILRILKETKKSLRENNVPELKNLSNQTINTASLTQDSDNIAVAVIVYSLSKVLEKEYYRNLKDWHRFYKKIDLYLDKSIEDIEKNNEEKFRRDFKLLRGSIENISGKMKKYIREVFRNSEIKKASKIHEHGISMEQTAKLLGISMYELADYVGKTGIYDVPESKTMTAKKRIKLAMEIFGK